MLCYSVPLGLIAGAAGLVACLATGIAGALSLRQVRRLQHLTGALLGMTGQLITGVAKLQVAGAQERAFASWSQLFSQKQRVRQRLQSITDTMTMVNAVLPTVASVVLFWGALRLLHASSTFTAGTFVAFHAAFGLFISGAMSLSNTFIDLLEVTTLWERVRPILVTAPEVDTGKGDPGRLMGKVALEQVTFRYQEHGPVILDRVSLHAEPGEFIALVGPSGSGKSTIFRLLLGFETPQAGAVYYDDQELSRLDVVAVRRQLGTVLQQSTIMAVTIFENIAGGALITQQEAWEAVHAAGLAEDITAMPMGLYTFVSEGGSNLSGGQRQRLLIARALVRHPALVLFDEATSALDNRTQAVVTASLERLRMTRVVIAHRLSTIRHADRIYVLVGGRMVQQGTFAELAQQAGPFAQLMAQQGEHGGDENASCAYKTRQGSPYSSAPLLSPPDISHHFC
jgi:ABC-type bacteriocin/lantibiotic exporter with double-glycine peptidase domain